MWPPTFSRVGIAGSLLIAAAGDATPDHSVEVAYIGSGTLLLTTMIGILWQRRAAREPRLAHDAVRLARELGRAEERIETLEGILRANGIEVPE